MHLIKAPVLTCFSKCFIGDKIYNNRLQQYSFYTLLLQKGFCTVVVSHFYYKRLQQKLQLLLHRLSENCRKIPNYDSSFSEVWPNHWLAILKVDSYFPLYFAIICNFHVLSLCPGQPWPVLSHLTLPASCLIKQKTPVSPFLPSGVNI